MTPTFRREEEATADLLTLVGVDVPLEIVTTWTADQMRQADAWAGAVRLKASDSKLVVPPMPRFLQAYDVSRIEP